MKKALFLVLTVVMVLSMAFVAQAEDTIKIGFCFPMSGPMAMAGNYCSHGAYTLYEQLGGKVEIDGVDYQLEFVFGDNENSEEKAINVYQKLIEEEEVIAIVGPDSSKTALAGGPIAQMNGIPNVPTFATNTAVTETGDYIFRACFIDPFQGAVAATYAWESGYKTAVIMYNNADAYAIGLAEAFTESFEALGGQVLATEEYSGSDVKDYNVQLTKLAAQNADVLLLPNLLSELGLQIQQARSAGMTGAIICGDSADTPEVARVAGPAIEGVAYVSAFSAESDAPAAVEFVEAYTTLYPDEIPNSNAELTYEALAMVIYALQHGGPTSEGVKEALTTLEGLELPSGIMSMGPDRNPEKGAVIMQYDADGVAHYLASVNP